MSTTILLIYNTSVDLLHVDDPVHHQRLTIVLQAA